MPITETSSVEIVCDNPACPNVNPPEPLARNSMNGWLLITAEIYGQTSEARVYCSFTCAAVAADARAAQP